MASKEVNYEQLTLCLEEKKAEQEPSEIARLWLEYLEKIAAINKKADQ